MKFATPTLRVSQAKSAFADGSGRWTNRDLDPVPLHRRKWGVASFIAYWISDALNAATWEFASGMIAVGLTYRESLAIVAIAFLIVSVVISANGAIGAMYHSPFPVLARASWGFYGSYIAIVSRVILAVFWFAIQTYNGSNSVTVMIGAIWPSYLRLPNHIPTEQGITTNGLSAIVPIAWISILIWAFKSTGGGEIFNQKVAVSGSQYSWMWLANLTSVIGNYATLSVNQSDFSRYSRVSVKWQLMYIPMLPIVFTFFAFIGVASSSAGQALYNLAEIPWDPNVLMSHWENRACRFFGAFTFALASLGVNISANSLSAANDFAALAPEYLNIRRGQMLCALFAWALVPWKILASAGNFLNFMSAYAVFLGPIAAIMAFDFWLIKKRKYDSLAMYQPNGIYKYSAAMVNWRAVLAFIVGVAPSLPGLINSVNSSIDVGVGIHPYQFGWLLGFFATTLVYVTLSYLFPVPEVMIDCPVYPDEVYDTRAGIIVDGLEPEDSPTPTETMHKSAC
ncbi:Uracil permease [Talaromyces islandicus]|uniref:Uracil permease n=1 Tax=Talaromyces islandicus TaxID=28573 RepID=A0A0U1LYR3_TALIS|nr:Uracil permease [Talaromyces islandicus]